jgi:hypothetical protein
MLEDDDQHEMTSRLATLNCAVEVPLSLRSRLSARGPKPLARDDRRRFARFSTPAKMLLDIQTTIPGIERAPQTFVVLTIDVSREGVAFLHASELFPGELAILWFPDGQLACRIVRCLRHNAACFEIGAAFEDGPQTQDWIRALIRNCTPKSASRS